MRKTVNNGIQITSHNKNQWLGQISKNGLSVCLMVVDLNPAAFTCMIFLVQWPPFKDSKRKIILFLSLSLNKLTKNSLNFWVFSMEWTCCWIAFGNGVQGPWCNELLKRQPKGAEIFSIAAFLFSRFSKTSFNKSRCYLHATRIM